MVTDNLWPKKFEVAVDELIVFLRTQATLLGGNTDDLLEAYLHHEFVDKYDITVHPPEIVPKEIFDYYVRPVNGFLHGLHYRLFTISRKGQVPFPFELLAFPDDNLLSYNVTINDFKSFVSEYIKIINSEKTLGVIKHMIGFVKGYRSEDI